MNPPGTPLRKIERTLRTLMTPPDTDETEALRTKIRAEGASFRSHIWFVLRESLHLARHKGLADKSASLTYTFILSIVPLLAIAFTFFKSFGGLQNFIDETVVPVVSMHFQQTVADQINEYIRFLMGQLDTKALSVVSFVTFLGTVIALLMNIEKCVNEIFDARRERGLVRKFFNYWVLMSFTPVVIGFSSVKSTQFLKNFEFSGQFLDPISHGGILDVARYTVGLLTQTAGFLALFAFLPARRTGFRALLVGAITTTALFEALQFVNLYLTRSALSDSTATEIYGTIPLIAVIFFVWIRLIWLVVLLGACVCRAAGKLLDDDTAGTTHTGIASDLFLCARLFDDACAAFEVDGVPNSYGQLASARGLTHEQGERVLWWLTQAKLLFAQSEARETLLVPTPKGQRLRHSPREFLREMMRVGSHGGTGAVLPEPSSAIAQTETAGSDSRGAFPARVLSLLQEDLK